MNKKWFDFNQHSFEFNLACYWYNADGGLHLYFITSAAKRFMVFNGNDFFIKSLATLPAQDTLHPLTTLSEMSLPTHIKNVRQNEDNDFYLLLKDNFILKIYSAPDDVYDNRFTQLITLIEPKKSNQQYLDTMMDYQYYSHKYPVIYQLDI